jgi:hypothetical protein
MTKMRISRWPGIPVNLHLEIAARITTLLSSRSANQAGWALRIVGSGRYGKLTD